MNGEASRLVNKALLCKLFRCLPSELEKEDAKEIELYGMIYEEMSKKNPLMMI